MPTRSKGGCRVEFAPQPEMSRGQLPPNRVISVKLNPGEEVRWIWTSLPDGGSYVSGYKVVKMDPRPARLGA